MRPLSAKKAEHSKQELQQFKHRLADREQELAGLYRNLYHQPAIPGDAYDPGSPQETRRVADQMYEKLIQSMTQAFHDRDPALLLLDKQDPCWYLSNDLVGMMLYVDLFAGTLTGIMEKIPYFKELGITYVHFMPLLCARKGENDGGFAVADYREIDPRFGNMEEFRRLVAMLNQEGIHVCMDYVVNHTAKEHSFARRAQAGEQEFQDMYYVFDTDELPKAYETTMPEVFPKVAPGNFTYYPEMGKWAMTSFYEFQWDLNYHNPRVFLEMADTLLFLANTGARVIRLDAVPFMWKVLGTNCRNLPQVHTLLRMFRIITEIVCPGVALLGEAIVEPFQIVKYFGSNNAEECHILYNAAHMVNIWNSLATRDARLMEQSLKHSYPQPDTAIWINYARSHDDIGWGLRENILRGLGFDPFLHKQFLIDFYQGEHPASFAMGELYEFDPDIPDARNSGSLASLAGLEMAIERKDQYQRELALKRIQLIHAQLLAESGIPLFYSGDEIATLNDENYRDDSSKAHDSRWLHRPLFDWKRAENRKDVSTTEGQVFQTLSRLIRIRRSSELFRSDTPFRTIGCREYPVYSFLKSKRDQNLVFLGNYCEDRLLLDPEPFRQEGFTLLTDLITGKQVDFSQDRILLGPYEYLWLHGTHWPDACRRRDWYQ